MDYISNRQLCTRVGYFVTLSPYKQRAHMWCLWYLLVFPTSEYFRCSLGQTSNQCTERANCHIWGAYLSFIQHESLATFQVHSHNIIWIHNNVLWNVQSECGKYMRILYEIFSIPQKNVIDPNNAMASLGYFKKIKHNLWILVGHVT